MSQSTGSLRTRAGNGARLADLCGALLGLLAVVWGFLTWYSPHVHLRPEVRVSGLSSYTGYEVINAYPPVVLALLTAALVASNLVLGWSKRVAFLAVCTSAIALLTALIAVAVRPFFLAHVDFGDGGSGIDYAVRGGLVLMVVTVVLQFVCLGAGLLLATNTIVLPGPPPPVAVEAAEAPPPEPAGTPADPFELDLVDGNWSALDEPQSPPQSELPYR